MEGTEKKQKEKQKRNKNKNKEKEKKHIKKWLPLHYKHKRF